MVHFHKLLALGREMAQPRDARQVSSSIIQMSPMHGVSNELSNVCDRQQLKTVVVYKKLTNKFRGPLQRLHRLTLR